MFHTAADEDQGSFLYVSPHLDDAVLSAGGLIAAQLASGRRVTVATVVTRDAPRDETLSPLAARYLAAWGSPTTPFADRCVEDIAALGVLGARHLHMGFLDCTYRHAPSGRHLYATMESLFSGDPDPEDTPFMSAFGERLGTLLDSLRPSRVYAPLTVGRHVDHVCVARVVHAETGRRGIALQLWEDFPYCAGIYPPQDPDTVPRALNRQDWARACPVVVNVDMGPRIEASLRYVSQIRDLFGSVERMRRTLHDYAMSVGSTSTAERFWFLRG